jgi:DNA-binding transcriptional LysR family regulator
MSKLDWLETFINVVDKNSFAAAARKQGISAAAISRQIAALEKELKTQLLQRSTRHLKLTEPGRLYYQRCKEILNELTAAEAEIAQGNVVPAGELSVTSSRYFAQNYLLPYLAEFMQLYPKLTVKLELAERLPDLISENIDVLLGVSMVGSPDLIHRRIATTRYVMCASPKYLKQYGIPKKPEDLIKHNYITHSMRAPADVLSFDKGKVIQVKPMLWLNDAQAMLMCAVQGMGIVKLHDYMVKEALAKKQLVEVLASHHVAEQAVYLYYQPGRYLQTKIRCFIDFYLAKNSKN